MNYFDLDEFTEQQFEAQAEAESDGYWQALCADEPDGDQ